MSMTNWTRCKWSIVIGRVWECKTCGATARVEAGDIPLRCSELDAAYPKSKSKKSSDDNR
jgi:hypothetical protein